MIKRNVGVERAETRLHFAVVSPQQPRHYSPSFSSMMGWNPAGNLAGMKHTVVQKPFLRAVPRRIPPWGALMDKWGSGSSAVLLDIYFCHRRVHVPPCSMHLQPCGIRLGGLVVHVHHVLSRVAWWLVNQLCSSLLPGHKHADIHAVKPGHALTLCSRSLCVSWSRALTSLWHFEDTRDVPRTPHLMCFFYSPSGAWCGVYSFYAY